jgi:hypothetical protein
LETRESRDEVRKIMTLPAQGPDPPSEKRPSDEALAPFRRQVAQSGMSDDELRAFFEELREEVYREKHGDPVTGVRPSLDRDGRGG